MFKQKSRKTQNAEQDCVVNTRMIINQMLLGGLRREGNADGDGLEASFTFQAGPDGP